MNTLPMPHVTGFIADHFTELGLTQEFFGLDQKQIYFISPQVFTNMG